MDKHSNWAFCLIWWGLVFPGLLIASIAGIAYGSDHSSQSDCLNHNANTRPATRAVTSYYISESTTHRKANVDYHYTVSAYGYYRLPSATQNQPCKFEQSFCKSDTYAKAEACFFRRYTLNVEVNALIEGNNCVATTYQTCWPQSRLDTELWVIWISLIIAGFGVFLMILMWIIYMIWNCACLIPSPNSSSTIQLGAPEIITITVQEPLDRRDPPCILTI